MIEKKGTPTASSKSTFPDKVDSMAKTTKLSNRQRRALAALLERSRVPCKELGLLAGQNNFAELAAGLRRKFGYDAILTGTFDAIDRDGQPCRPGYYTLSPLGRERALKLLGGDSHA